MNLQNRFNDVLLAIGFPPHAINSLWMELEKAYSAASRQYHNVTHLEEMIALFDIHHAHLQQPTEILYSIFYHDIVYKTTRKDNELKSAELALANLPQDAKLDKQLVFDAICATQLHQHNTNEDINYLIDFDLKILSKPWDEYLLYCQQIRKEYKIYPNILYKPGRKKALQHFLEQEFVYNTALFRELYDAVAKENLSNEISLLTGVA
jgi:predicted metal-dependent HD superfamily phosphohydrolase